MVESLTIKSKLLSKIFCIQNRLTPLAKDNSEYKRKIRNLKVKHQKLICSTMQIASMLNFTQFKDSLGFYLAAVAFPNDLKKILKNAIKDIPQHESEFKFGLQAL